MKYKKYKNIRTKIDNITFDSKKEAGRYLVLRDMEKHGIISHLECQPKIPLIVNDKSIGNYIGDFRYQIDGKVVLEDVKSKITKTPVYNLKKKILLTYTPPIVITEIM